MMPESHHIVAIIIKDSQLKCLYIAYNTYFKIKTISF